MKKIFAVAVATVMTLAMSVSAFAADSVTVKNVGWWDAWTPSYELADGATLEFDVDMKTAGAAVYQNFNMVFCNVATDGKTAPKAPTAEDPAGFEGYAEYVVLRSDNFGWGTDYANTKYTTEEFLYQGDTVDYAKMLTGGKWDVTISRAGNKITVDYVITTSEAKTIKCGYEVNATDLSKGCHVFFTGDAGAEFTLTKVENVPTGDFTAVLPVALVAVAAMAVVVVMKKRTVAE